MPWTGSDCQLVVLPGISLRLHGISLRLSTLKASIRARLVAAASSCGRHWTLARVDEKALRSMEK